MLEQLASFVDGWVGLAKLMSFEDVRTGGEPPWATVSSGAAGHAYALWYAGRRQARPAAVVDGARWWRVAMQSAERRSGFRSPAFARVRIRGSVPFGRPGLHAVAALIAHERGQPIVRRRELGRLATMLGRDRDAPSEFMLGRAGALTTALAMHRFTGDPEMRALADAVAARLLAEPEIAGWGFAHGRAGVLHALLAWSQATGAALPDAVFDRIRATTAAAVIAAPTDMPGMTGSWCNGLAGLVLLWARAFEITGEELYRRCAREAIQRLAADRSARGGSLCCGLGGEAYAALALHRIDRDGPWHAHAAELCGAALAGTPDTGVFKGLSGLVCLAIDLTTPGDARFPFVEP